MAENKIIPTELTEYSDLELTVHVERLLCNLGISKSLKGYRYLIRAIELVYAEPSAIRNVITGLYRRIADEYNTNASCVERNCRTAIGLMWHKSELGFLEEYFPYAESETPPSVREFTALLADKLKRNLIDFGEDI